MRPPSLLDALIFAEENRPRWGDRTSNPGDVARRRLVGSTPASSATFLERSVIKQRPVRRLTYG